MSFQDFGYNKNKESVCGVNTMANKVGYTMRLDRELFEKFRYIADANGRSANRELEQLIRKLVSDYEAQNGVITSEDLTRFFNPQQN
jgi:hypothetical protein